MGFMKSVGKALTGPIGQGLASLIPGVGPFLGAGLGMAGSAFANSGQQGGQSTTGQSSMTGSSNFNRNESGSQNILEDPLGAAFRQSLIPQMQRMNAAAEQPVYGEAEKASFLNNLNDLSKDAAASLRSNLAATGRLDSGSLAQGLGDLEMSRFGQFANFQSQLPLLNRQYQDQARQQAMTLSQGLVPLNRLGTTTTGQSTGGEQTTQSGNSQSNTTYSGPSFLKGLAGQFGGLMGDAMGGNQNPLARLFQQKTQPGAGTSYTPGYNINPFGANPFG